MSFHYHPHQLETFCQRWLVENYGSIDPAWAIGYVNALESGKAVIPHGDRLQKAIKDRTPNALYRPNDPYIATVNFVIGWYIDGLCLKPEEIPPQVFFNLTLRHWYMNKGKERTLEFKEHIRHLTLHTSNYYNTRLNRLKKTVWKNYHAAEKLRSSRLHYPQMLSSG